MMSEAIQVAVLVGLMTACLSRLVTRETGLFGMFVRLRNLFPEGSQPWEILNCPLCFGVYCSGIISLIFIAVLGIPALWFFAIAPAALGLAYATLGLAAMIQ